MIKSITFNVPYEMETIPNYSTNNIIGDFPNYEKTNIKLALYLSEFIKNHSKEIGVILDMKIKPSVSNNSYNVTVYWGT